MQYFFLLIITCLFLSGCQLDSDIEDLKLFVHNLELKNANLQGKNQQRNRIYNADVYQIPVFKFASGIQRNPFVLANQKNADASVSSSPAVIEESERFSIEQITMVGYFRKKNKIMALIKNQWNEISYIEKGEYLQSGRIEVIEVNINYIKLREQIAFNHTGKVYRNRSIKMVVNEPKKGSS